MISHQAYFEFLAGTDQTAPDWHPVLAGLAVLRLVDSRMRQEPRGSRERDWASFESARTAVSALNEGNPVRAILLQLVDAVSEEDIPGEVVGHALISYGRALNFVGRWALASDVFSMADRVAGAPANPRISIESNIALGAASRRMGDWDVSAHAYARAAHVASTIGDSVGSLQVEVGLANTQLVHGNLPAAELSLDQAIDQARANGWKDVLGLALHSRATVAHLRGAYADAVRLGYEALETMSDLTARDAALSDLAAAFAGMGMRESARDSYLIVAATAQSQWVRWQATLNLMELAALDDQEARFDAYARELDTAALDPRLRAYYFLFLSAGQQRFGRYAEAEASLTEGLAIAEKNQLHQVAHEVSMAIGSLKSRKAARIDVVVPAADVPASLKRIAAELTSIREAALSSS